MFGQIDAIGVDEIQYAKGHKYLTLVYQIDLEITRLLWVDFAFLSSMEYEAAKPDDWHNVPSFGELSDALHKLALTTYPESDYAKRYGDGKVLPIRLGVRGNR